MKPSVLILGVGNYLMGDEGIGCHAIPYLEQKGYGQVVDLLDGGTGGFHLMEHLTSHEHVILIDAAIDTQEEGTVRVFRPKVATDFPHSLSTHEIGLKDLITALTLTESLPDLYLIAVSVKDFDDMRMTLSQKIEEKLADVEAEVRRVLKHLGLGTHDLRAENPS